MGDIYATPEADLAQKIDTERAGGNVDDAIAGNIEIGMLDTMGEAWRGMKGFKLKCHIALTVYGLIYLALYLLTSVPLEPFFESMPADEIANQTIGTGMVMAIIIGVATQILLVALTFPMLAGVMIMAMRHAQGKPVTIGSIFGFFGSIPGLALAYLLSSILILIGFLCLILPGIYLYYAYMHAMPLIVEKKMGAWQAMETSRKALTRVWFRFFGINLLIGIVIVAGFFTLGIAWIWIIPWAVLGWTMIYVKLFGIEAHTLAD